jgi:hypothetical protein
MVRIVVGLTLLLVAVADEPGDVIRPLELYEWVLGLVVFPAMMVSVGLVARRSHGRPLRFTGPGGITINLVAIIVLFAIPYTAGAAALFYGTSLLVAAWRGAAHCEATVLSNLLLQRDDEIGCPTMTPIDAMEARAAKSRERETNGASSSESS